MACSGSATGSSGSYSTRRRRRAAGLLGLVGGDDRDRLAVVADPVDRQHRLVRELEPVGLRPGHVLVGQHRVDPGIASASRRRSRAIRAWACGLRTVCPRASRPPGGRSSTRTRPSPWGRRRRARTLLADARRASAGSRRGHALARRQARPRRGSSRSRCSGRGCRRAPRGSRRRSGRGTAAQQVGGGDDEAGRAEPALDGAGVDERLLHAGAARRPPASPSTVTTSWPSACAARTRQEQTSSPSRSTEHEPHSPCSQAFFEPGSPRRSRSASRRLSPSQTSASWRSPLTASATLTRGTSRARAA